jgi:hypothetical protein
MKALSVRDILRMKKKTLAFTGAWNDAFGLPEAVGVWFIWGHSGNGKTSFVMQLCKELCKFGTVAYDSLEEGYSLTMINTLKRYNMMEVNKKFVLIQENINDLEVRMNKRKSPDFYVIDSMQYTQMNYARYIKLKEAHKDKLMIIISHARGSNPEGRSANGVMYDAALKIWIEGYKAVSKGRFIGKIGSYTIWDEGAKRYWGQTDNI